ncbi:hypothetical protein HK097_005250, partial [Rhizophlyctis rosea]
TPAAGGWKFPSLRRRRAASTASSDVAWTETATEFSGSEEEDSADESRYSEQDVDSVTVGRLSEVGKRGYDGGRKGKGGVGGEEREKGFKKTLGNFFGRRSRSSSVSKGGDSVQQQPQELRVPSGTAPPPPGQQRNVVTDSEEVEDISEESYSEDVVQAPSGGGGLSQVVRSQQIQHQQQQQQQDVSSPGGLAAAVARLTEARSVAVPSVSSGQNLFKHHSIGTIAEEESSSERVGKVGGSHRYDDEFESSTEDSEDAAPPPRHPQQQQQVRNETRTETTRIHSFAPPSNSSPIRTVMNEQRSRTVDVSDVSEEEEDEDDDESDNVQPPPPVATLQQQQQTRQPPTKPAPQPKPAFTTPPPPKSQPPPAPAKPQQQQEDETSLALTTLSSISDIDDVMKPKPKSTPAPQPSKPSLQSPTKSSFQQGRKKNGNGNGGTAPVRVTMAEPQTSDTISDLSGLLEELGGSDGESERDTKGKGVAVRGFASQAPKSSVVPRRFEEEDERSDSDWDL